MNPFPYQPLGELMGRMRGVLVFELSAGQMVEDVRLAAPPDCRVEFFGRMGGILPPPDEVCQQIREFVEALHGS